jgi:dTDP-4-amino-4,6-dideoxygalactose transaminase
LRTHLTANGIGTEVYYPVPFHRQECFASLGCTDADYPNANTAAETSLALPIYPELTGAQIEYVVAKIEQFHQR